jgi:hypothetical protein
MAGNSNLAAQKRADLSVSAHGAIYEDKRSVQGGSSNFGFFNWKPNSISQILNTPKEANIASQIASPRVENQECQEMARLYFPGL